MPIITSISEFLTSGSDLLIKVVLIGATIIMQTIVQILSMRDPNTLAALHDL